MRAQPITFDPPPEEAPKRVYREPVVGPNTLAGRLLKRRKELDWTQMHLAELIGTTQAVIQKIENGKSLRPRIIEEIADALGTTPQWLMYGCTGENWPAEVAEMAEDMRSLSAVQLDMVRAFIGSLRIAA